MWCVAEPDEGYSQSCGRVKALYSFCQRKVLQAVGFSDLSFGSVAVNGMVEALFGYRNENFDGWCGFVLRHEVGLVDGPYGKDNNRTAFATLEKAVNLLE